ncbi:MAG TPA: exosortase system-associated protein, TIGR04073 family [bacterium]|nr:exosortase system-associated protein, TIGR04073 family [bacterium]
MKTLSCFLAFLIFVFLYFPDVKSVAAPAETVNGVTSVTSPAAAYTWKDKLKRGALNIISSPVEIARSIQITSNEESLLKGWTIGLVKGLGDGFLRLGAGVVDVLTCPFNFPDSDKAPLIHPEYVWQKPGTQYS